MPTPGLNELHKMLTKFEETDVVRVNGETLADQRELKASLANPGPLPEWFANWLDSKKPTPFDR